ncbi:MAG: DUF805 domain-containing protein [Pseudomonadota bacterium]
MSVLWYPFTLRGRIGRATFWKLLAAAGLPWLLIVLANDLAVLSGAGRLPAVPRDWLIGLFVVTAWIAVSAITRRYHDRGRSIVWLLLPLAYASWFAWDFILASEAQRGTTPMILREIGEGELRAAFESAKWTAIAWATGLAFLTAPALLMLVDLGLMPGKRGENRFGPPVGVRRAPSG